MDRYICLKKSDVAIPTEEEESSSEEDDGDDDEGDEDEEDEDGNGEGSSGGWLNTTKREPAEVEEEVELKEEEVSDPFDQTMQ